MTPSKPPSRNDSSISTPGRYRTNVASVLRKFATWARDQHTISNPEDIDDDLCRQYARDLARADGRDDILTRDCRRYFAYVRSFLTWPSTRA